MDLLATIEQSGLARLLKGSFYVYPLVNALHIAAIGTLFASVWLLDLRIVGAFARLPEEAFVEAMRKVALTAFAFAVLTGLALFAVRASEYAAMPVFLAKMGLIALAGINLALFTMASKQPQQRAGPLRRATATLSVLIWAAVLLAGRFIGFT